MIGTIKDLIKLAKRLPQKWMETFVLIHEDWQLQLEIWSEKPETLSEDEGTHAGIKVLADRLLGKEKENKKHE